MTQKLKKYLYEEVRELKKGVLLPEYICWWIFRFCMAGMIIYNVHREREKMIILTMCLNFFITFIIPILRIVFFKKIFLGNLPYRVQSFIDMFVFAGSFLGHGLDFNGTVENYDKYLHFASGGIAVIIGYLILKSVKSGNKLSPGFKTVCAAGFSCVVIVLWEIFEFFSDMLIENSLNQNPYYNPENSGFIFFKIFGYGVNGSSQYPVLDTDLDIIVASFGIAICALGLYIYLKIKEKNFYPRQSATSC